jgi:aryl-alcohol dehydrogenase-like predicted oxidoreductase
MNGNDGGEQRDEKDGHSQICFVHPYSLFSSGNSVHARRPRVKEIHQGSDVERLASYNGTGLGWKGLLMNYRRFGRTGWNVGEIGYGMWGMAGWTGSEDQEPLESLQHAVDLGCNFFDTAWAYGDGHSETLLRKIIRANPRKTLYAATKIPPKNRRWPSQRRFSVDDSYPPEYIEEYVHKSLDNIGVSKLDLIQFHTWEDDWLDDDRLLKAIEKLRTGNDVRAVGISLNRWEPSNGIRAVNSGLIDAVQVIYNIFDQNPEDQLFPACREKNVAVIARVPFDEGTLTGTLTTESKWPKGDWRNTYFVAENLRSSVEHAAALKPLLRDGMTMPEMALRFILNNPDVSTIIPGMRKRHHVETNLGASVRGPLPAELHAELRKHRWDRTPTSWSQ